MPSSKRVKQQIIDMYNERFERKRMKKRGDNNQRQRSAPVVADDHGSELSEPTTDFASMPDQDGRRSRGGSGRRSNSRGPDNDLKYGNYRPSEFERAVDGGPAYYDEEDEGVYIVRQEHGYFAIMFALVQTVILGLMMWQCGIAPLKLNPMFGPYPDALSEWGGKNATLIIDDDQWWRLITPILLHAGIIHLVGNVAVQLELGVLFEREWGSIRWLLVYLGSGVGSSILSVIFMPKAVSVGSSGAVMGLFGAKLSELVLRCFERKETKQQIVASEVRREQGCAVTCSVIIVLLFSFVPYVDWAAHVGGLIAGICIGIILFCCELELCIWKCLWLLIGMFTTAVGFAFGLNYMYSGQVEVIDELRDVCGYYQQTYEDYECNCQPDQYFANQGDNQNDATNNNMFFAF